MFPNINIFFIIFSILFLHGCSIVKNDLPIKVDVNNIIILTPFDKNNVLFKEHLKRLYKNNNSTTPKFHLRTSIAFSSVKTLTNSSLSSLKKVTANVKYTIREIKSGKVIKSGLIKSFPVIGSTSNSLYANDTSLIHAKERLTINMSQKLYMHISMILRRSL